MHLSQHFYEQRKVTQLVENQTSYTLDDTAMHVFETHQAAAQVELQFSTPVLASMFKGKKVMHLRDQQSFDFLPGESLILPAGEVMCIDFPNATLSDPTQCLAMEISEDRIQSVVQHMNERMTKTDGREWNVMDYNFHFTNDEGIYQILQRLVYLFTENHPAKDLFVSNMVQELIIRILQANSRKAYQKLALEKSSSQRFTHVIQYIKKHLSRTISIKELSDQACMSESNFYKVFKQEMGLSPVDFINQERINKAVDLLKGREANLTEIFMACGFSSRSYFNRVFKRYYDLSPGDFRQQFVA
ncbi:hypothetical protein GCM10009117_02560 [Gangjinia marincola]|uniref:HTH araC/xylS-type domain-containing protein n=1 Tax=Gangjinia marincola TaxID=578463 RepID=A0ABP3XPG5_9FLAO